MSRASDRAYEEIRRRILEGLYRPGMRLTEEQLAVDTGVSRTPVREAIQRLLSEFYLTLRPGQGLTVTTWEPGDIAEIFELRALLEAYGARRAAMQATRKQMEMMLRAVDAIEEELAKFHSPDPERFLAHNLRFHKLIIESAQSERLALLLGRIIQPPIVTSTAMRYRREDIARANAQHRQLVEAIRARDPDWSSSLMTAHILAARAAFAQALGAAGPVSAGASTAQAGETQRQTASAGAGGRAR